VDFITKPSHYPSAVKEVREEVVLKVKTAAHARAYVLKGQARRKMKRKPAISKGSSVGEKLVVIGASAGGPKALAEIMPRFPENTPAAIVIVQHMPGVFTRSFASRLNNICSLQVKEAEENEELQPGRVLVAPGGKDLVVISDDSGSGRIELIESQNRVGASPRIDATMVTAAEVYGAESVGVIMTGMGSDGASGMEKIKKSKGGTIAQDEETCLVYGMPKVAIERGCIDWVVSLDMIPDKVMELL
jgi:two-component system chemotaxis response regulator CheB